MLGPNGDVEGKCLMAPKMYESIGGKKTNT